MDTFLHVDTYRTRIGLERVFLWHCELFLIDAHMISYVRHLKIGRKLTSMISGRLLTSMSQNFDVLSTFCGRKYVRLDVIQNTDRAYRKITKINQVEAEVLLNSEFK